MSVVRCLFWFSIIESVSSVAAHATVWTLWPFPRAKCESEVHAVTCQVKLQHSRTSQTGVNRFTTVDVQAHIPDHVWGRRFISKRRRTARTTYHNVSTPVIPLTSRCLRADFMTITASDIVLGCGFQLLKPHRQHWHHLRRQRSCELLNKARRVRAMFVLSWPPRRSTSAILLGD